MTWRPTIGLEVHVELNTHTKMFCDSRNSPRETRPNVNICPVCMAHPGTLPVINLQAVRHVVRLGRAVGGTIAAFTEFDRKNYFYPDIPKGYQISQYAYPIVSGGALAGVALTRVHLEEDTARSIHDAGEGTVVDYNRAGVPLMELVTEPVIHDAETAGAFARELQITLRTLGASEANMEEGQMRVEVNVSVSKDDTFGTKVEIKNLNSFRSVERALRYEIERQIKALEAGERVIQETRGWDEVKEQTFAQRKKESSHDYRYFPDPDLPKLQLSAVSELSPDAPEMALPEMPWERRVRLSNLGLKVEDAAMFTRDLTLGTFFDRAVAAAPGTAILAANYLASDLAGKIEAGKLSSDWFADENNASRFGQLMAMILSKKISSRGAKDILEIMLSDSREPHEIAESSGLYQQSDATALEAVAQSVIDAHEAVVKDFKSGKTSALQFLLGQGMKASRGSADPEALRLAFEKLLR